MTRAFARIAALTLTFAVIAAVPLPATRYDVTVTERDLGAGAERGTLELRIPENGVITGYYRPMSGGARREIAGGRDGDRVWLDIGTLHVTAVFSDRGLAGRAFRDGDATDYLFDAERVTAP